MEVEIVENPGPRTDKLIRDFEIRVGTETLRLRVFPEYISLSAGSGEHQILELNGTFLVNDPVILIRDPHLSM